MVHRNILFALRTVKWSRGINHPDPRALACARWFLLGAGRQVGTAHTVPTDDAVLWQRPVPRTRAAAVVVPQCFYPGQPLSGSSPGVNSGVCVRFCGTSDPAASYRTCDPYLAGARYQRLLRADAALMTLEEACGELGKCSASPSKQQ